MHRTGGTVIALLAMLALGGTATAQKSGGILRFYHRDSPSSLSIHEEGTFSVVVPAMGIFNNLVVFDPKQKQNSLDDIIPDLAESWSWDEARTALTFKLRSGVKWHDSKPFTADSAARYAITQLDSVVATVKDSTQYLQFARVLRGRALLDVGRYAEAAAAVASVPTDFVVQTEGFSFMFINPYYWSHNNNREWTPMGEREGGNGLPFVSTNDPRIGPVFKVVRYNNPADSLYDAAKYTDNMAAMTLSSGIEARLIEAEAALNAGDPSWFTTLNTLRATMIVPAMAPIASMPVTTDAKVDLLYQERAFWLYLTGRRLGDLRRLMRNYGRGAETLFPTGPYSMRGGNYSTATAIPFVQSSEQRYNPNLTSGCTTR